MSHADLRKPAAEAREVAPVDVAETAAIMFLKQAVADLEQAVSILAPFQPAIVLQAPPRSVLLMQLAGGVRQAILAEAAKLGIVRKS
jgi:hypothetical protein